MLKMAIFLSTTHIEENLDENLQTFLAEVNDTLQNLAWNCGLLQHSMVVTECRRKRQF